MTYDELNTPGWTLAAVLVENSARIKDLESKLQAREEAIGDMLTTLGQVGDALGVPFKGAEFNAGIGERMIDAAISHANRLKGSN